MFLEIGVPRKQEKSHLKEFILSKSVGWEPATLPKTELLKRYFSRVCSNQKLTFFKLYNLRPAIFKEDICVPVSGYKHYAIETKEN